MPWANLDDQYAEHPKVPRPGWMHPKTWGDGVMPLNEFPAEKRTEIERAVARRTPPPRRIPCGGALIESRAWWEWHWSRGRKLRRDPYYVSRHRQKIPSSLRAAVYERDGHACVQCGSTERLSLDHIYPHSRGGQDVLDNLQTLCRSCNSRKGARV